MHVLHILDYSPPFAGGFHDLLLALGEGLGKQGHRVTFGFPRRRAWFDELSNWAEVLAIPEIRHPIRSGFHGALQSLCRSQGVDLVHLHFSFALPLSLACSRGRWRLPVVYHWHNPPKVLMPPGVRRGRPPTLVPRSLAKGLASALARFTDARTITRHVAVSQEIRDLLVANRWSPPTKIVVVPNAIPTSGDSNPGCGGDSGEGIVIGCVANFRPQKDHVTLIRAFQLVAAECPDCRLVLVGDGPCRQRAMELALTLGLDNRIDFVGYLDDPRTAYSTFNIAVLSSHYEGQSMVVLEAMNAGLPVVAARVGGIPDTISDGVEGLLVPMEDAAAMAGAILQLAKDAGLRAMMGAAGRRRVVRDFGADTWVGNLLQLYSSILDVSVVPTA